MKTPPRLSPRQRRVAAAHVVKPAREPLLAKHRMAYLSAVLFVWNEIQLLGLVAELVKPEHRELVRRIHDAQDREAEYTALKGVRIVKVCDLPPDAPPVGAALPKPAPKPDGLATCADCKQPYFQADGEGCQCHVCWAASLSPTSPPWAGGAA